jgi:hypothetical protein
MDLDVSFFEQFKTFSYYKGMHFSHLQWKQVNREPVGSPGAVLVFLAAPLSVPGRPTQKMSAKRRIWMPTLSPIINRY